jgi:WD40 repeat protein
MSLVAKISIHSQQICGMAWSPNGKLFASGGNDDLCCLFEVDAILDRSTQSRLAPVRQWSNVSSPDISNDYERSFQRGDDAVTDAQNPERGRRGARTAHVGSLAESATPPVNEEAEIRGMRPAADGLRSLTHGCERHC